MKKFNYLTILLLFGFVCSFGFSDFSYAKTREYTIGVEDINYYPHYSYKNNEYKGISRDIFNEFAKSNGYRFKYKAFPVNRLYSEFIKGNVDFKYPDNPFWQTDKKKGTQIFYSSHIVQYIDGVLVRPEKKGMGINNLKSLSTLIGFTPWSYMKFIESKQIQFGEVHSLASLLNMTIKNNTDGAYVNIAVARHLLAKNKRSTALVFDPELPHEKDYYTLSSINHPSIIREFNTFLIEQKNKIDQIKSAYKIKIFENIKKEEKIVYPLISEGARGTYVKILQTMLKKKGYYHGTLNGIFDYHLSYIVKKYQHKKKLRPDGLVGKITWNSLNE